MLLILVVFLLFASELWQAAHTLGGADLLAVLALLLAVATILVVTQARSEIGAIEASRDRATIEPQLAGTPAESLAGTAERSSRKRPRPLRWQERMNLVLLMLVSQLVQSAFVAVLVAIFLVTLGVLAIPASVQEIWVGEPARPLLGFELLGEPRLVSVELLITAALLGGVSALYFTGLALTDAAFRAEFHEGSLATSCRSSRCTPLISPHPSSSRRQRRSRPNGLRAGCHRGTSSACTGDSIRAGTGIPRPG